jgi:hypothetical protein
MELQLGALSRTQRHLDAGASFVLANDPLLARREHALPQDA